MIKIAATSQIFTDRDGTPLNNGKIYIGLVGQDPITNPAPVFLDNDLTEPAALPLRTSFGRIVNNGTPTDIYIAENYSITITNQNDVVVQTLLDANQSESPIEAAFNSNALVRYDELQGKSETDKAVARTNIGAASDIDIANIEAQLSVLFPSAPVFTSLTLAEANTSVGDIFRNLFESTSRYAYTFTNTGAGSKRLGSTSLEFITSQAPIVADYPSGLLGFWSGKNSEAVDNRYIANDLHTEQSENIYYGASNFTDEQGGSQPNLSRQDGTLGPNKATRLAFTGQFQPVILLRGSNISRTPNSSISITASIYARTVTGAADILFGHGATGADVTAASITDQWSKVEVTIVDFTTAKNLQFQNGQGQGAVDVEIERLEVYDRFSGIELPNSVLAHNFDDTLPLRSTGGAFTGSIPYDRGLINPTLTGNERTGIISFPGGRQFNAITLCAVVDIRNDRIDTFPSMCAISIARQLSDSNARNTDGMLASYGSNGNWRPYIEPRLNTVTSEIIMSLKDQGPVHMAVAVDADNYTIYINGVPVHTDDNHTWEPLFLERLSVGGYAGISQTSTQINSRMNNRYGQIALADRVLSDTEIADLCKIARANIVEAGGTVPELEGIIADGDSQTSNTESPPWFYTLDARIKPYASAVELAVGGSRYGSATGYETTDRKAFRERVLEAYGYMDYSRVLSLIQFGTNDMNSSGLMQNLDVWEDGRTTIDALFLDEINAVNNKYGREIIRPILVSPPDRGGTGTTPQYQDVMTEYQNDCVFNWEARGYKGVIETHLYTPDGFASQQEAADDAITNNGNDWMSNGGVHYQAPPNVTAPARSGGQQLSDELFAPKILEFMRAI